MKIGAGGLRHPSCILPVEGRSGSEAFPLDGERLDRGAISEAESPSPLSSPFEGEEVKRDIMPIHMAITRKVKPGNERAFEDSLREFFQESLDHQGVLGVHLISPPPGANSREYGILRTCTSEHERDAFYRSDLFGRWQKHVAELWIVMPVVVKVFHSWLH